MRRMRIPKDDTQGISRAECAVRTGLSLRALRVYEEQRLIKPARSAQGWRSYSASDLSRLATIKVLKGLGLSLSQIREVFTARSPSLAEILQIQAIAWKARQKAALKAMGLIDAALRHLEEHRFLAMDTLCELIRMYSPGQVVPGLDEQISAHFRPHQSRLWSTWWAQHPNELAESARFSEAQLAIFGDLRTLMASGRAPGGDQAQALMRRWEGLFLSHRVRERTVRQLAWNYDVTFKWFELVHKNRVQELTASSPPSSDSALYTPRFAAYLGAAHQHSAHGRALAEILAKVTAALTARVKPASTQGRGIAAQLRSACEKHALGDPLVYARFALFIEQINHGLDATAKAAPWKFAVAALSARQRGPRPAKAPRSLRRTRINQGE